MIEFNRPETDARHQGAAAALTELSALAVALGRTADLPAVMLTIEHDLTMPVVSGEVDDRQPALVLAVDECLLFGDPTTRDGQTAAGAMAHEVAWHTMEPGPAARHANRTFTTALAVMLLAAALSWPGWVMGTATAVAAVAGLAHFAVMRRWQLAVDACAARMLADAGLNGHACMDAMFARLARDESGWHRATGWLLSTVPTAAERRLALIVPPRRIRWASVGVCRSTGHRVGTRGHRHAHKVLPGRCWPSQWSWLPSLHRPVL